LLIRCDYLFEFCIACSRYYIAYDFVEATLE
jgi:hypothetical protein